MPLALLAATCAVWGGDGDGDDDGGLGVIFCDSLLANRLLQSNQAAERKETHGANEQATCQSLYTYLPVWSKDR